MDTYTIEKELRDALDCICRIRKRTRSMRTRCDCFKAAESLLYAYCDALGKEPDLTGNAWLIKVRDELLDELRNNDLHIVMDIV